MFPSHVPALFLQGQSLCHHGPLTRPPMLIHVIAAPEPQSSNTAAERDPEILVLQNKQVTVLFCSSSFSSAWMKELPLSTKERSPSASQLDQKPPLSASSKDHCSATPPCPSTFLSQRASSALPLACVRGLYTSEVPLRLFVNVTNDRCVEPLAKDKDLVALDNL